VQALSQSSDVLAGAAECALAAHNPACALAYIAPLASFSPPPRLAGGGGVLGVSPPAGAPPPPSSPPSPVPPLFPDPHHPQIALLYATSLLSLSRSGELFTFAHALVADSPLSPIAWYAVGCYYASMGKFSPSASAFARATTLDPAWGHGWLGLATAYAGGEEGEPALAAFRSAQRCFPGSAVPYLGAATVAGVLLGQETLAASYLAAAATRCPPGDISLAHERGCAAWRAGAWVAAREFFEEATVGVITGFLGAAGRSGTQRGAAHHPPLGARRTWEPSFFNLGHCHRKLGSWGEAVVAYREAGALVGRHGGASVRAALGLTLHLGGDLWGSVESYHGALALAPEDVFASKGLAAALKDMASPEYGLQGVGTASPSQRPCHIPLPRPLFHRTPLPPNHSSTTYSQGGIPLYERSGAADKESTARLRRSLSSPPLPGARNNYSLAGGDDQLNYSGGPLEGSGSSGGDGFDDDAMNSQGGGERGEGDGEGEEEEEGGAELEQGSFQDHDDMEEEEEEEEEVISGDDRESSLVGAEFGDAALEFDGIERDLAEELNGEQDEEEAILAALNESAIAFSAMQSPGDTWT